MATTASFSIIRSNKILIGNVGDSRVYLHKSGCQSVEQLTHDALAETFYDFDSQTFKQRLWPWAYQKVAANLASFEGLNGKLKKFVDARSQLSQSLDATTTTKENICNIYEYEYIPGDKLLLITDGIHDNLTDGAIATRLASNDTQDLAEAIIKDATEISKKQEPSKRKTQRSKIDDMAAIVVKL